MRTEVMTQQTILVVDDSLLLLQQGIHPLLIERRADISWYPRARNLNFRTLEISARHSSTSSSPSSWNGASKAR